MSKSENIVVSTTWRRQTSPGDDPAALVLDLASKTHGVTFCRLGHRPG